LKNFVFVLFFLLGTHTFGQPTPKVAKSPTAFIPSGYVLFDEIRGDLNKDNQEDCVLIIKATEKSEIVELEAYVDGVLVNTVDLNRRGIIIALKKGDQYELVLENRGCFSSEEEPGSSNFPPNLFIDITKGKLEFHYIHGKYGDWKYIFRYQNSDFELIGYDETDRIAGYFISSISMNFITKKVRRQEDIRTDEEKEAEKEAVLDKPKLKETWGIFKSPKPFKLREIMDFDEFSVDKLTHVNP
jgi:hypothetical protein